MSCAKCLKRRAQINCNVGMSETDFSLIKDGLAQIRRAHAIPPVTAIQSEYATMIRQPESDVLALCEELEIGFVPYSPLSLGLITGYTNERTKYSAKMIIVLAYRAINQKLLLPTGRCWMY